MNDNSMLYLVLLGFASGFINMFAGGGSMLVVPFLIFLGLPPHVANATNRVAILLQNIVSTATFRQKKILNFKTDYPLLLPTTLGSILGAFTAVDIQAAVLQKMIGGLLVVMFFMILLDPNTWVKSNIEKAKARHPWVRFWGSASMAVLYKSVSVFLCWVVWYWDVATICSRQML